MAVVAGVPAPGFIAGSVVCPALFVAIYRIDLKIIQETHRTMVGGLGGV